MQNVRAVWNGNEWEVEVLKENEWNTSKTCSRCGKYASEERR